MAASSDQQAGVLYQVDESAPLPVTTGIGLQYAVISLSGMVLMPTVTFRAADVSEALVTWAVFASLVICGAVTALQARPLGRIGAGYILSTAPTGAAIAVSVDALTAGGPALLGTLMVVAAGLQLAFSMRLSLVRRILTPTVSGVALMLIPVTIMPVIFDMLDEAPPGHSLLAAPACAGATILVIGGIMLKGSAKLRLWAPVGGIAVGSIVALFYGLYDVGRVADAGWFGIPGQWPPIITSPATSFDFGPSFVGLLPAFVLLFLVCTIRSMSSSLAIQTVSWRRPRAMDFRPVQGAVAADALANMASGLAGTVPTGVNSGTVARTLLTGVAARGVGVVFGVAVVVAAFFPKVLALVLAVPGPVFAGYVTVMVATTFSIGLKMAVSEGLDHRQGLIVGMAFWIGTGCQYGLIFPDFIATFAGGMLKSGLTSGGLVAILLTVLLEATAPRRRRMETRLALSALPELRAFAGELVKQHRWDNAMAERLDAVSEETLLTLLRDDEAAAGAGAAADQPRRLLVTACKEGRGAVLEFIAAGGEENIEDRLAILGDAGTEESVEREVSLRLLRHLASEVRHRQYHDADIVTVRVAELDAPE